MGGGGGGRGGGPSRGTPLIPYMNSSHVEVSTFHAWSFCLSTLTDTVLDSDRHCSVQTLACLYR